MSTRQNISGQSRFEQLRTEAIDRIRSIEPGNSFRLLIASPRPTWLTNTALRGKSDQIEVLMQQIQSLQPTSDSSDLVGSLLAAVAVAPEPTIDQREIIVLSDGQQADWSIGDDGAWDVLQRQLRSAPLPTSFEIVGWNSTAASANNVSLTKIETQPRIVGKDQPLTVTAHITNHGVVTTSPAKVEIFQRDQLIRSIEVPEIEPQATQTVSLKHSISKVGSVQLRGVLRFDSSIDDGLASDNHSSVVVQTVERIPIIVVDYGEGFGESDHDAYFLNAALGRINGEETNQWQSIFDPRVIPPKQLESIALSEFQAVVLPSLEFLSDESMQRLTEFVRHGGGLWLATGPRTDASWFNNRMYADGDGLSPVRLDQIVEHAADEVPVMINPYLGSHPATRQLADSEKLDTGDVRIRSRFRFDTNSLDPELSVLLGLTNGQPLTVEQKVGHGRVILQSIPLRLQWSDLIQSQAFVVMVQDWLSYLVEPLATQNNLVTGQPIQLRRNDSTFETATLRLPSGQEAELTGQWDGESVVFFTTRTHHSGLYDLELGVSGESIPFWVARDESESDLAAVNADQRRSIRGLLETKTDAVSSAKTPKRGKPLWTMLLIALVVLIGADVLLSGAITRGRFGVDSIGIKPSTIEPTTIEPTPLGALTDWSAPRRMPKDRNERKVVKT